MGERRGMEIVKGKLLIGMLGWSAENIKKGSQGYCYFPTGPEDPRYRWGYRWERHRVVAMEDVRAYREVVVMDEYEHVKEHTPVETKPLGYVYDDFAQIAFTATPTRYVIGTNAYNADRTLPSSFLADILYLEADQDCYVRFEADTRVEHLLLAGVQYEYKRRTNTIWVRRRTVDGTLMVRALGNEVGV